MNGTKTCPNGHQMDASWRVCPYCRSDVPQPGLDATVRESAPAPPPIPPPPAPSLGATVREPAPIPAAAASTVREAPAAASGPRPPDRRTMRMSLVGILARGWLVPLSGPQKGEDFRVDEAGAVIGADPHARIRLENDFASGRHLQIRFGEGGFSVVDLKSTNGTALNGEPVSEAPLADGDRLTIGTIDYVWKQLVADGGSGRP